MSGSLHFHFFLFLSTGYWCVMIFAFRLWLPFSTSVLMKKHWNEELLQSTYYRFLYLILQFECGVMKKMLNEKHLFTTSVLQLCLKIHLKKDAQNVYADLMKKW